MTTPTTTPEAGPQRSERPLIRTCGHSLLALVGEVAFGLVGVPLLRPLGPLLLGGPAVLRMPTGPETATLIWLALPVTVCAFWSWYNGVQRLGSAPSGAASSPG